MLGQLFAGIGSILLREIEWLKFSGKGQIETVTHTQFVSCMPSPLLVDGRHRELNLIQVISQVWREINTWCVELALNDVWFWIYLIPTMKSLQAVVSFTLFTLWQLCYKKLNTEGSDAICLSTWYCDLCVCSSPLTDSTFKLISGTQQTNRGKHKLIFSHPQVVR